MTTPFTLTFCVAALAFCTTLNGEMPDVAPPPPPPAIAPGCPEPITVYSEIFHGHTADIVRHSIRQVIQTWGPASSQIRYRYEPGYVGTLTLNRFSHGLSADGPNTVETPAPLTVFGGQSSFTVTQTPHVWTDWAWFNRPQDAKMTIISDVGDDGHYNYQFGTAIGNVVYFKPNVSTFDQATVTGFANEPPGETTLVSKIEVCP
jgi:hypothetical protein